MLRNARDVFYITGGISSLLLRMVLDVTKNYYRKKVLLPAILSAALESLAGISTNTITSEPVFGSSSDGGDGAREVSAPRPRWVRERCRSKPGAGPCRP